MSSEERRKGENVAFRCGTFVPDDAVALLDSFRFHLAEFVGRVGWTMVK